MKIEECMAYLDTPNFMNPDPGLENIAALLEELDNPQKDLHFIHIAGTNGKGSTAAFMERILRESGYRTGLYTSPYLIRFSEKIQINGNEITDDEIIALTQEVYDAEKRVQKKKGLYPTVFERVTALALKYFHEKCCDVVVLETGLGGRLDATNIVTNTEVAIITAIGLDHTDILGDTKEKIAEEKSGIIKTNCDVVLYEQEKEIVQVIAKACQQKQANLCIAEVSKGKMENMTSKGQVFSFGKYENLRTGMLGIYQMHNAITALCAAECLQKKGWKIDEGAIRRGLEQARWMGRLEIQKEYPLFLVDAAHNPQGVSVLAESLNSLFPNEKKRFVLGVLADKAYEEMLDLIIPQAEAFYVVTPRSTRALNGEELAKILGERGFSAKNYHMISEAVNEAIQDARKDGGVICAFGSLYYIGEVISYLKEQGGDWNDK